MSRTSEVPVHGGDITCFEDFLNSEIEKTPTILNRETLHHLVQTYGSEYREILKYCEQDTKWAQLVTSNSPVIKGEILHGIREEMAYKLSDIVYRRTELGTAGYPGDACLRTCAEIIAAEWGWSKEKNKDNLQEISPVFPMSECLDTRQS